MGLKPVADYAGQQGIELAIEPLNRFETDFINTVEQGLELIDRIGASNVGLLLDTFHMNIEEKTLPAPSERPAPGCFTFIPVKIIVARRALGTSNGRKLSRRFTQSITKDRL
jgi:hypothetical protein